MFKKLKQIRKEYMGINERNINFIYPNNPRQHYKLADDKVLAKGILQKNRIRTPETYGVINRIGEIEKVWNSVEHHQRLVLKPACGRGGSGILIMKKVGNQWFSGDKELSLDRIFSHIANTIFGLYSFSDDDKVIIEQCIIPHEFFGKIYSKGVPDIRVITYKHTPVMAMLRLPTNESDGKANLHQGGLGVGIDLKTGTLMDAYNGKGYLAVHPDSHEIITGKVLPHWNEIIKISKATSKVFPLKYLGVDLIIDQHEGPGVIEVNVRPGLGIQMANRKGLKTIINNKNHAA
ncbi:MAG: alpha-L-glutamate ligase-like protein [Bacteroidia bacterium]